MTKHRFSSLPTVPLLFLVSLRAEAFSTPLLFSPSMHPNTRTLPTLRNTNGSNAAVSCALRVIEKALRGGDPSVAQLVQSRLSCLVTQARTADASCQAVNGPYADLHHPSTAAPLGPLTEVFASGACTVPWVTSERASCAHCGRVVSCQEKACLAECPETAVPMSVEVLGRLEGAVSCVVWQQRRKVRSRIRMVGCRVAARRVHRGKVPRVKADTAALCLLHAEERRRAQSAADEARLHALAHTLACTLPAPPPVSDDVMAASVAPRSLRQLGFASFLGAVGTKRNSLCPLPEPFKKEDEPNHVERADGRGGVGVGVAPDASRRQLAAESLLSPW